MTESYDEQPLQQTDPAISGLIDRELRRQQDNIELIASENFTPRAVLEAVGSVLTNKYSEGYPAKRYYGGCDVVDAVETLAIERAKDLFGAEHANVQPHSGSAANQAVYFAALEHGDTRALHASGARGPSHSRTQGELLRTGIHVPPLPSARGHRSHRLR